MSAVATLREEMRLPQRVFTSAEYTRFGRELTALETIDGCRTLRFGVLSSCSFQFIEPSLVVEGVRRNLHVRTHFGPFAQFEQQITNPGSPLHAFQPQALLIFMRPEDIDPDIYVRFHARDRGKGPLDVVIDRVITCVEAFRQHSAAPVLVANFAAPEAMPLGPFDANISGSLTYAIAQANQQLQNRVAELAGAFVWDYAGVVRAAGSEGWCDRRLWALARIPIAADRQPIVARHLARTLASIGRASAKCLVLDLDNTVWGGVIGDDGMEGIQLGDDYPGNAFKAFQRAVLGLADRGILLAVVSKNDAEVVDRALREHPEMLIRPEHIAAMRVNWQPKSQNLHEIAAELNIGLDALVHFDDNPMERAEIAANAPEVLLVDVPSDPLGYVRALYECGFFDAPTLSNEDTQRVEMYRTERARDAVRASARTVEEFLSGLEMVAETGAVDEINIGRVAQLVGKTNQFNLTTRRHSQADISRMSHSEDHTVVYLRLNDRFGDLGLIGVGIVEYRDGDAIIDSFVMSCRAMGRLVENGLLWELAQAARLRGCERLLGDYIPTARNGMVSELYPTLGFERLGPLEGGGERFVLNLSNSKLQWPSAIRRSEPISAGA